MYNSYELNLSMMIFAVSSLINFLSLLQPVLSVQILRHYRSFYFCQDSLMKRMFCYSPYAKNIPTQECVADMAQFDANG